ncbi:MAG: hypothetical protein AAB382_12440, partial [Chloroflexota bacterium]
MMDISPQSVFADYFVIA